MIHLYTSIVICLHNIHSFLDQLYETSTLQHVLYRQVDAGAFAQCRQLDVCAGQQWSMGYTRVVRQNSAL